MFLDTTTSRQDLLNAVYGDDSCLDWFLARDIDPELVADAVILENIQAWIEAGDECA